MTDLTQELGSHGFLKNKDSALMGHPSFRSAVNKGAGAGLEFKSCAFLWSSLDQTQVIKDERQGNLPAGLPTPLEFRMSLSDKGFRFLFL